MASILEGRETRKVRFTSRLTFCLRHLPNCREVGPKQKATVWLGEGHKDRRSELLRLLELAGLGTLVLLSGEGC